MSDKKSLSIYIHIPFCRKRCGYCDFNTYTGLYHLLEKYVDCVLQEIAIFSTLYNSDHFVQTIYFGGGTPTIMPVSFFAKIINTISNHFPMSEILEISSEANPIELDLDYLFGLHDAGINRLSIGMQSAVKKELEILERLQNPEGVSKAVLNAKNAGFKNISLDLIYGIPTQTLMSFELSIESAVSLKPQHLSIYGLSLEPSTPLAQKIKKGHIPEVDEDTAGDMYAWVIDRMHTMGYKQYEISNWSLENNDFDFRCFHNLQYWKNRGYLGIGAGAHSFIEGRRWSNTKLIQNYIGSINKEKLSSEFGHAAIAEQKQLSEMDVIKETLMMGLRLTEEGINTEQFKRRFSLKIEDIYFDQIKKLMALGLIEYKTYNGSRILRLTKKGRMFGNQVFLEFI
jgi:oxygen-independent coproporphyrinogen-3 oxidase